MPRTTVLSLCILLFALYFVQGLIEPTAGLPAQPLQASLERRGLSPTQLGHFLAFIGIPWSLKVFFGLISDFLPIGGKRRQPYLILSTAAAALLYLGLAAIWPAQPSLSLAAWLFFGVCGAIAMTDVVVDALAVEFGQPRGLTGQLQSIQWGAMSAAAIAGSALAGVIAAHGWFSQALLGCGLLAAASLLCALAFVREAPGQAASVENLGAAWREVRTGRRLPILIVVGLFLYLWNFNPFSSAVLQHYSTDVLGFSQEFYGLQGSILAIAQLAACGGYALVCRRIPLGLLVHGSILMGILSTLCYLPMHDSRSAIAASVVFGLSYQTATLIQLDLAARVCPTRSAATVFALLMAISNTGITSANAVSGAWYDQLTILLGSRHRAFDALVLVGAGFTAACWMLVPVMRGAGIEWHERTATSVETASGLPS